ncbi:MAG: transposase [Planctomycetaceae bacterium]
MDQHLLESSLLQRSSMSRRRRYPSDVTDDQWSRIAPLLPFPAGAGRPRQVELREVVNGINFRWTTGCVWRMLPHDLPPWETIYTYYRQWMQAGLLPRIRQELTRRVSRSPQRSRKNSSVESRRDPRDASGSVGHSSARKPADTNPDRPPVPHLPAGEFASSGSEVVNQPKTRVDKPPGS